MDKTFKIGKILRIDMRKPKYYLNPEGKFVIENYNFSKPFANFLPGIAGKYGIPMWVFYVNRAQAIASFGTKDKDHAILEFFPANKAWQFVSLRGFRTFIKVSNGKKTIFYEPFRNGFINSRFNITNRMYINSYDLRLEEDNLSLGLKVGIEYFTIPNDSYAGLARIVTMENTGRRAKTLQILDGLPQIVPYGATNLCLKKLGRTIEAWMNIENLNRGVPFYKLDVEPKDTPEVIHIKEGNFYLGFYYDKQKSKIIKPIVDPQCVFGPVTDFSYPQNFLSIKNFSYPKKEIAKNKTPSGFLLLNIKLKPRQEKTFYSVIGHMRSKEILNSSVSKIIAPSYLTQKKEENKKIIQNLQQDIATVSSLREFNLYAQQTYLDNIMRGGYPVIFSRPSTNVSGGIPPSAGESDLSHSVFYLYSRKHGDLERDYNKFQIQPTYFSQGNGNYRDMNQNRRCDIWFNPKIKDENVITFFNLLQADGFNPLVIKGVSFTLRDPNNFKSTLKDLVTKEEFLKILTFLERPFSPGEVILFIEENKIKLKVSYDEFLNILISHCQKNQEAEHGDGFWTDHWTYCLDLLESYLDIYPENLKEIIFDKKVFTFYDNTEVVRPRHQKYVLKDGLVRQLHSIVPDNAKREMLRKRTLYPHIVRMQYGKGEIYQTTLMNKLLCLLVNKLASLDPFGCGIEMEADKPNWFDALNGLPGLFGSSICETFQLKRLILFIKQAIEKIGIEKIYITEETHNFLIKLNNLIEEYFRDSPLSGAVPSDLDYRYWDKSYTLKEDYRQKTRFGFNGKELEVTASFVMTILNNALRKIDSGINKARDAHKNIYYTYFINEVVEYQHLNPPFVKPIKFIQKKLPFFLEGQVQALRSENNIEKARAIYKSTKFSELYDKKLKMYKITAPLNSCPFEIGRCRVFSPGWLENESIWLHMEYKYLLETLKSGLYEEFYEDFRKVLIPLQNPSIYGRSILENSSFIVSSAFSDKNLWGNGFVARLSGTTAEFLQMWLIMNLGEKPFILNDKNELNLKFRPILADWLFTPLDKSDKLNKDYLTGFTQKDKTYSFNFLGKTWVVYHNPKRKNTFGRDAVCPKKIVFNDRDGNIIEISSDTIPPPYALKIRARQINRIDVYLG